VLIDANGEPEEGSPFPFISQGVPMLFFGRKKRRLTDYASCAG
jgi:hypothetical protein